MVYYDFCPFRASKSELLKIHGHSECLSGESLSFGSRLVYEIVEEWGAFKTSTINGIFGFFEGFFGLGPFANTFVGKAQMPIYLAEKVRLCFIE